MNFGFVIDNRACIGCHACSTACKSENDVPLGVYRTWVKYVESGSGADARRHFQVTRCNHCANPPCVRICPVTAMYQRHDGIVEFDSRVCIGCKACLQACPYDAIHIDPQNGTAAKCHYCSHRVDLGLEPSCVVVCPTHAILAGDIDDPSSEIARVLAREKVTVRRPEQGTAPKLFYVEGTDLALHPTAMASTPQTFLFAEVLAAHSTDDRSHTMRPTAPSPSTAYSGARLRPAQPQGVPLGGAVAVGARMAEHMVQVSYNAQHHAPWHWPVAAYLVTKGIGSGLFALFALSALFGWIAPTAIASVVTGSVVLLGLASTTALLVYDLERPERFLSVLLRPQWKSWLVRGAYLLIGFTAIAGLWWFAEIGTAFGWWNSSSTLRIALLLLGLPFALGTAIYTAFLFGQAEGRDLWQSPLLPIHMTVQAVLAGAATMMLIDLALGAALHAGTIASITLGLAIVADLGVLLLGELGMPHASEAAARAAHAIRFGRWRPHWIGSLVIGHAIPLLLLLVPSVPTNAIAAVAAITGLVLYEIAFVMAPQEIPNS